MPHTNFTSLQPYPRSQRMAELRRLAGIARLANCTDADRQSASRAETRRREGFIPQIVANYMRGMNTLAIARALDVPCGWVIGMLACKLTPEQKSARLRIMRTKGKASRKRSAPHDGRTSPIAVHVGGRDFESIQQAAECLGVPASRLYREQRKAS